MMKVRTKIHKLLISAKKSFVIPFFSSVVVKHRNVLFIRCVRALQANMQLLLQ